jgi:hypothetical protein
MDSIGGILLGLYILISQIMSVIFFIDVCKQWDSIVGIIFLGPIVAEFKGLLWIFFIW